MTGHEVLRRLRRRGCVQVGQQRGSHVKMRCPGGCSTVVPDHRRDLAPGTLAAIRRDLRPCIGGDW